MAASGKEPALYAPHTACRCAAEWRVTMTAPPFTLVPADDWPQASLHAAFAGAFADYVAGPFTLPLAQWPVLLARQGVDLALSRIALRDGQPAAFALVAPRPARGRWRLATMGALPSARGSGAAPALLDDLIVRATAAGVAALELEVFAQNPRALSLYRGRGFQELHELHGHTLAADAAAQGDLPRAAVTEVDREAAFAWLDAAEAQQPELPLQVTALSLAALQMPLQAWQQGRAQLVFSLADDGSVVLQSLVDLDPAQPGAAALLVELRSRHPGRPVKVPALQRDDLGGRALQAAGFERQVLHQLWMRRGLHAALG